MMDLLTAAIWQQHNRRLLEDCGTGAGGFKGGNTCAKGDGSSGASETGSKYGKSKAETKYRFEDEQEETDETLENVLGTDDHEVVASIVGAPDDSTVEISYTKDRSAAIVRIDHKDFVAKRRIGVDDEGNRYIENEEFWVKEHAQGKGIGSDVFGRQVEQARENGVSYIKAHAAKDNPNNPNKPHNGYYTWPRMGYDQSLTSPDGIHRTDKHVYESARQRFPEAKTVFDVMSTKEGRDWWKANGTDMLDARFDLSRDSRSSKVLEAYQRERAERGK